MSKKLQNNEVNPSVPGNVESAAAHIEVEPSQNSGQLSWYQQFKKIKSQSNSLAAGFFIWTASYMHLACRIYGLANNISKGELNEQIDFALIFLWFTGAIAGSYLGRFVVDVWSTRVINFFCGIPLLIAGIYLLIPDLPLIFLLIGPFIAGGIFGINYISTISHAADNTIKSFRGYILVSVTMTVALSTLMIDILLSSQVYSIENLNIYFGALASLYATASIFIAPFWTYESIVLLLRRGDAEEALSTLIKLRKEKCETFAIRNEFDELKLLISEEYSLVDPNNFSSENLRILKLIIGLKVLNVFTSNVVFYTMTLILMISSVGLFNGVLIITISRIFFMSLPLCLVDKWGRKRFLLISGYGCGISLTILAVISTIPIIYEEEFIIHAIIAPIVVCCIHSFVALGIGSIHNIYSAEAFPLAQRTTLLSSVSCVEYFLHLIIFIFHIFLSIQFFLYFWSISIIALTFWLNLVLPESRGLSLRQCRDEFNKTRKIASDSANTGISSLGSTYS